MSEHHKYQLIWFVVFTHFRLEYLACPLFASVTSFRLHFQSVLLMQQMFVPANKLEISVVLLLLFQNLYTHKGAGLPSAQLFSCFALLAGHLLAAVVLQLFTLVVVRSHFQQPAALYLNHLWRMSRERLRCASWQEYKSLLYYYSPGICDTLPHHVTFPPADSLSS